MEQPSDNVFDDPRVKAAATELGVAIGATAGTAQMLGTFCQAMALARKTKRSFDLEFRIIDGVLRGYTVHEAGELVVNHVYRADGTEIKP